VSLRGALGKVELVPLQVVVEIRLGQLLPLFGSRA